MSSEDVKERQRKHWTNVASGWAARLAWTERWFSPLTDWFRRTAGWTPGARVLDIACGAGYPALAAAWCVKPGGTVVATDISPDMLAVTSGAAKAAGLDNIECLEMDAEALDFDDASFDAVTNAYGLMFCPHPDRAVAEVRRVLKPGGRFAFVVWDEPAKSPFFTVITGVATTVLSLPRVDPTAPGPFRFAPPGAFEALVRLDGFAEVLIESLSMTFECDSVAEYCQIFSDVAWKARMAALSPADMARFMDAVAEAARPYRDGQGRLRLPTASWCASGRKS